MLHLIINEVESKITTLALFERYGGLVRPKSRKAKGDGQSLKMETFPISSNLPAGANCWEGGRYRALTPDSSKKSVAYFEEVQPLTFTKREDNDWMRMNGIVRFVYWLNVPKLNIESTGDTDPEIAGLIALKVIKVLDSKKEINTTNPLLSGSSYRFQFLKQKTKNDDLFAKYSYQKKNVLTVYPYDAGAVEFKINLLVSPKCLDDLTLGTPIDCITI